MLDFTDLPRRNKTYAGANGSKISVLLDKRQYMIKFPAPPSHNKKISYANGCVSEYLGSHIFEIAGISAQKTMLGTFTKSGQKKLVVACRDFTSISTVLQDFASLKNTIIDSEHSGYGTDLQDILETIDRQCAIDPSILQNHFWNMFIVDALIGNWDRHNGNWGFLYNVKTDSIKIAPVFDCGSCLFPQADETIMKAVLSDPSERDLRVFTMPLSALKQDGKKINYFDFITSMQNVECNKALSRIVPRLNMKRITKLVMETPGISDLQKQFYITILEERKKHILDASLQKL